MEILDKSYKRKNSSDSDVFTVDKLDGEYVIFSNGARCKIATLITDFDQVQDFTNEPTDSEVVVNPDTFFDTPIVDESLIQQMESIVKNSNTNIQPSARLHESVSLDDDSKYEKVAHGGNTGGLTDRLTDNGHTPNTETALNNPGHPRAIRMPEYDVFDNVKLSEEIEILIPFKIRLPKAEKIDLLNDMFKTSFTAYLSKKFINDDIVKNSAKLQITFQKSIEDWMEGELNSGGNKRRKTVKKGKTLVQVVDAGDAVEMPAVSTETFPVSDQNASSFFGRGNSGPAWDGDVKKLFTISSEEQYVAVKKKFIQMKDNKVNSPDVDRFEDMLQMYEEQTK